MEDQELKDLKNRVKDLEDRVRKLEENDSGNSLAKATERSL